MPQRQPHTKAVAVAALLLTTLAGACAVVEGDEDDNRNEAIDGADGSSNATAGVGGMMGAGGGTTASSSSGSGSTSSSSSGQPIDCIQELTDRGIGFDHADQPGESPDGLPNVTCVIDEPIEIDPVLAGVSFRYSSIDATPSPIFTGCMNGLALVEAAEMLAGMGVTDVVHYGTYNCRVIGGTNTLSEHGRANAMDYVAFKLDSGEYYTVLDDWEKNTTNPTTPGGKLLYDFAWGAFQDGLYTIMLTPNFNPAHADHLHGDLTPGAYYFD